jgi:hypothetical protein
VARQAVKGSACELCFTHGGHCPHGRDWIVCRDCNPNATKVSVCCSSCAKQISTKRKECNGGTGYCCDCDANREAEAAEAGHPPPPKSKNWEDVVLDELVTLVTDVLWVVRDADARIVAALDVEVDEHSHTDRDPACETGKVDETYQSIVQLAQKEGAAKGAAARAHVRGPPFVLVLKINPNACDAPGPKIPLKERIRVLAEICNNFLRTPAETFHAHAEAGYTTMPNVQCLFYHTKQGAKNLAYFDENTPGVWRWAGNECRTEV